VINLKNTKIKLKYKNIYKITA